MRILGLVFLLVGFVLGLAVMFQMESLRINISNKMVQDGFEKNTLNDEHVISLARKIAIKSNEVSRVIYIPLIVMFIGVSCFF